jgi:hypothetical protein
LFRSILPLTIALVLLLAGCDSGPPPLSEAEIVDALIAHSQAPDRTIHAEMRGAYRFDAGDPSSATGFLGSFNFSGDDYAGTVRMVPGEQFGGPGFAAMQTDVIVVAGEGFTRSSGMGGWRRADAGDVAAMNMDPLRGLSATSVEYLGVESSDGVQVHRIKVADGGSAFSRAFSEPPGMFPGEEAPAGTTSIEVYVDDRGKPLAASLLAETNFGGLGFRLQLSLQYEFSEWGGDFEIVAPF